MGSNNFKKVHFIGIGGIGMSALAQMLADEGAVVSGSDRSESPVTEMLESKGIHFVIGQNLESVPSDADTIVYSDALELADPEFMKQVRALGMHTISYFGMLGKVSEGKRTVAVAGTHGKTTTTGMLAKILLDVGANPTAIVGSIVKDFGSNYLAGKPMWDISCPTSDVGHDMSDMLFVVEACEYRDHLLELAPQVLVINNIEWDHTDYFPSLEALQETFRKAIARVPESGAIVTNPHDSNVAPLLASAKAKVIDYTQEPAYELRMPGEFNQMNARAAAAAARVVLARMTPGVGNYALTPGVDGLIAESLANFHGTWRRFEYKGKSVNGADVYDDYAHHPTAVRATLEALRDKLRKATPCGKIFVAFHPHLYSRTRDLLDEFATAFGAADKVFIAPIFAAREVDDGTVSSEMLAERIRANGVDATALDFDAITQAFAEAGPGDAIMTMGAGDIYKIADKLVCIS
ncbi:MAG: Mur ligase domain-containing protein [Candidatus Paceibacterota bacterium]